MRGRGRRRPLEADSVVPALIVVPPFPDARRGVPSDKNNGMICKLLLEKVEVDDKAETIPFQLLGTTITIGKSANRITYGPRSGEGRREMG